MKCTVNISKILPLVKYASYDNGYFNIIFIVVLFTYFLKYLKVLIFFQVIMGILQFVKQSIHIHLKNFP